MTGKTAAQLVQSAKGSIENLTPDQVHASRGMLEFYADPSSPYHKPELDPDSRVILHCASGGRSALAVQTLQELGYSNVAHLDGGFKAWQADGKPVKGPAA